MHRAVSRRRVCGCAMGSMAVERQTVRNLLATCPRAGPDTGEDDEDDGDVGVDEHDVVRHFLVRFSVQSDDLYQRKERGNDEIGGGDVE